MIYAINESLLLVKARDEVRIKVAKKAKIIDKPRNIPVTNVYPTGKHSSQPKS